MNPVQMANAMIASHGIDKAVLLAEKTLKTSEEVALSGGTPFSDEIEISAGDDGKERVTINEGMKAVRLKKTRVFWANVFGNIFNQKVSEQLAKLNKKK